MAESEGDRVEAFVRDQFGGASLQPPPYDLPSLRFTLGGDYYEDCWYRSLGRSFDLPGPLSRRKPRVRQAVDRAATLFEQVFGRADQGFFVAYVWPYEWPGVAGVDALLGVLPDQSAVERTSGTDYWDNDPEEGAGYLRLVAACSPRELDYRSLFLLLAHSGLLLEPTVSATVFVVNETLPAIFYMYDFRGALVFAPSDDELAPLVAAHANWLVSPA